MNLIPKDKIIFKDRCNECFDIFNDEIRKCYQSHDYPTCTKCCSCNGGMP